MAAHTDPGTRRAERGSESPQGPGGGALCTAESHTSEGTLIGREAGGFSQEQALLRGGCSFRSRLLEASTSGVDGYRTATLCLESSSGRQALAPGCGNPGEAKAGPEGSPESHCPPDYGSPRLCERGPTGLDLGSHSAPECPGHPTEVEAAKGPGPSPTPPLPAGGPGVRAPATGPRPTHAQHVPGQSSLIGDIGKSP